MDLGDGQSLPGAGLLPPRTTLTDGVVALRAPSLDDVEDYARSATDPAVIDFTHVPLDLGRDGATRFVVSTRDESDAGTKARFAVCRADSMSRLLGSISLVNIDWANRSAELGYWVLPEARSQGYAMRAVRLVQRWAFDVVGLARSKPRCLTATKPRSTSWKPAGSGSWLTRLSSTGARTGASGCYNSDAMSGDVDQPGRTR